MSFDASLPGAETLLGMSMVGNTAAAAKYSAKESVGVSLLVAISCISLVAVLGLLVILGVSILLYHETRGLALICIPGCCVVQ